jgi:hypothetical protein
MDRLSGIVAESITAMTALTAKVASGGGTSLAGATSAGIASFGMASERLKSDPSYQRSSTRSHLMALTGEAIKGSVAHIGSNLGQRFRGEVRFGNIGAQVGHSMQQEAVRLKELRESKDKAGASSESSNNSVNKIYLSDKN